SVIPQPQCPELSYEVTMVYFHVFNIIIILIEIFGSYLVILSIRNFESKHSDILKKWANQEGCRIIKQETKIFGSPWILSPPAQRVYRVVVEDRSGRTL